MINKKVITRRLVVKWLIDNVDEQRIGHNNLDHGTDIPPQYRKLCNSVVTDSESAASSRVRPSPNPRIFCGRKCSVVTVLKIW